jgi:hypothetical protein
VWQTACSAAAVSIDVLATTLAEGCRSAISRDRLGPETTAIRSLATPATCSITWLIRSPVPCSIPLARLTTTASAGSCQAYRLARSDWDGTASTTKSAPDMASPGSVTAVNDAGSSSAGK